MEHTTPSSVPTSFRNAEAGPSKPGEPVFQQPKSKPAVVFISSDASGTSESRQAIRRRAAQHSHRVGRKPPKSRKRKFEEEKVASADLRDDTSPSAAIQTSSVESLSAQGSASANVPYDISSDDHPREDDNESSEQAAKLALIRSHISSKILRQTLDDRDSITASSYPVPPKPWYPYFLDFMWTWMGQSWQSLDTTAAERRTALSWVQQTTMIEPCYFYMNLLSVADTLQDRGLISPWIPLWLTTQVVASINKALSDPSRRYSAGVILAVGRIALEEIVTGDREVGENVHRPWQARLIAMAGGLEKLGLPSLVLKHVCWADRVLTRITDVTMADLEPRAGLIDSRPPFGPQPPDRDLELLDRYRPQRRRRHGVL